MSRDELLKFVQELIAEGEQVRTKTGNQTWDSGEPIYLRIDSFSQWSGKCKLLAKMLGPAGQPWADILTLSPAHPTPQIANRILGTLHSIADAIQKGLLVPPREEKIAKAGTASTGQPENVTIGQLWALIRGLPVATLWPVVAALAAIVAVIFSAGWAIQGVYTEQTRNVALKEKEIAIKEKEEALATANSLTKQLSISQTATTSTSRSALDARLETAVESLGLTAIWPSNFSKEEDDRIRLQLKSSSVVKILAYTGEEFARNFEPEFREFLFRAGTKIELLLADPTDSFFINNTRMTRPAVDITPAALEAAKQNQRQTITRFLNLKPSPGQLEVRMYSNHLRLPAIIFDDTCVLTIRLPSSERQTIRIEFKNSSTGFYRQCSEYFNAVWNAATAVSLETLEKR